MPRYKRLKYLLVLVYTFSGWIEACPTAREDASTVADILTHHIVPRFGIQSDNGPAFVSQITQQLAKLLAIKWKLHIPYRLQSSGKVERTNTLIKKQLTKLSIELQTSWPNLLPMALLLLRTTPKSPSFLSPFELMYGRPYLFYPLPDSLNPLTRLFLNYYPASSCITSLVNMLTPHSQSQFHTPQSLTNPSLGTGYIEKTLTPNLCNQHRQAHI